MKNTLKKLMLFFAPAIALLFSSMANAATPVIDVLVVYTPGAANAYGGNPTTRINQLFNVANQIYVDSKIDLKVRVVGTQMVNYTDDNTAKTALDAITFGTAPFNNIASLRTQYNADMVVFYRPYRDIHDSCGLAWIGGINTNGVFTSAYKPYMFSHVAINTCGDYVTAHEMGHNMGLNHSRKQDGVGGTFPYALGHGVMNLFTDIMAYTSSFNVDYWTGKIYKFANPDLTCLGVPCGVSRFDTVNGADAAYTLNITAPQIANYYTPPCANAAVPKPSSGIEAKAGCSSISVGWAPVAGTTDYTLMKNGTVLLQNLSTSYIDTSVSPGVSYQYSVVACNRNSGGTCTTAKIAPTAYIPTALFQDFVTPKKDTLVLGAPLVGPSGRPWNALGAPHAVNETANRYCKDLGGLGAGNYTTVSNYGNGHAYNLYGTWWTYGGQAFTQISTLRCYF